MKEKKKRKGKKEEKKTSNTEERGDSISETLQSLKLNKTSDDIKVTNFVMIVSHLRTIYKQLI